MNFTAFSDNYALIVLQQPCLYVFFGIVPGASRIGR
jgi:hypothetical protein